MLVVSHVGTCIIQLETAPSNNTLQRLRDERVQELPQAVATVSPLRLVVNQLKTSVGCCRRSATEYQKMITQCQAGVGKVIGAVRPLFFVKVEAAVDVWNPLTP